MCFQAIILTPRNSESLTYIFMKFCGVVLRTSDINDTMEDCITTSKADRGCSLLSTLSFTDEEGDA